MIHGSEPPGLDAVVAAFRAASAIQSNAGSTIALVNHAYHNFNGLFFAQVLDSASSAFDDATSLAGRSTGKGRTAPPDWTSSMSARGIHLLCGAGSCCGSGGVGGAGIAAVFGGWLWLGAAAALC